MKLTEHAWLKALSGLTINISAAWFVVPFIGPNISFPKNLWEFTLLIWSIILGILFLLITVWCERRIEK